MEIQKVFSSYDGFEEERLYSVLMNEEELDLFSEIQKEFNSKAQKARRRELEAKLGKEYVRPNDASGSLSHR